MGDRDTDYQLKQSNTVMMYLTRCLFTDKKTWISIDVDNMKVVPPTNKDVVAGSYQVNVTGRVFVIDDEGNVVDDTEAWNRMKAL